MRYYWEDTNLLSSVKTMERQLTSVIRDNFVGCVITDAAVVEAVKFLTDKQQQMWNANKRLRPVGISFDAGYGSHVPASVRVGDVHFTLRPVKRDIESISAL